MYWNYIEKLRNGKRNIALLLIFFQEPTIILREKSIHPGAAHKGKWSILNKKIELD